MNRIIEDLGGIGTLGVVSVCLFVVVFCASLIWAFCQKKSVLATMESLPLDDTPPDEAGKGETRHE